jgi:hypothetical protein
MEAKAAVQRRRDKARKIAVRYVVHSGGEAAGVAAARVCTNFRQTTPMQRRTGEGRENSRNDPMQIGEGRQEIRGITPCSQIRGMTPCSPAGAEWGEPGRISRNDPMQSKSEE